jgi:single-strand DNA-binding protein
MNSITISGNLTKKPELKTTPTNKMVAVARIAVNSGKNNHALFIDVELWEDHAKALADAVTGQKLTVQGRLASEEWKDKQTGATRSHIKIVATQRPELAAPSKATEPEVPAQAGHA